MRLKSKLLLVPVLAALAALAVGAHVLVHQKSPVAAPVAAESALAALGGLRSLAAEVLWFRIERLQEEGKYVELAQLTEALAALQPHTPEVWAYASWNLAYNISVMMPTPADRWRWVRAGLVLLRDRALKLNPAEASLYRELAWMFEIKLGADIDSAAALYRAEYRREVAAALERGEYAALGFAADQVAAVRRNYRLEDLSSPYFAAVYFADAGLRCQPDRRDEAALREIIRQSLILQEKSKQVRES